MITQIEKLGGKTIQVIEEVGRLGRFLLTVFISIFLVG